MRLRRLLPGSIDFQGNIINADGVPYGGGPAFIFIPARRLETAKKFGWLQASRITDKTVAVER